MIHPIPPLQNLMSVDKGLWCRNENIIVHSADALSLGTRRVRLKAWFDSF